MAAPLCSGARQAEGSPMPLCRGAGQRHGAVCQLHPMQVRRRGPGPVKVTRSFLAPIWSRLTPPRSALPEGVGGRKPGPSWVLRAALCLAGKTCRGTSRWLWAGRSSTWIPRRYCRVGQLGSGAAGSQWGHVEGAFASPSGAVLGLCHLAVGVPGHPLGPGQSQHPGQGLGRQRAGWQGQQQAPEQHLLHRSRASSS